MVLNFPSPDEGQTAGPADVFPDHIHAQLDELLAAAIALGNARALEQTLEDGRALEKRDAMLRLIGTANELTGKVHSASSAESIVELDPGYAAYRKRQADAVVDRFRAEGAFVAAKLKAQYVIQRED